MRNDNVWKFKVMFPYDMRDDIMTRKKWEGIFLDQKLKIARRSKDKNGGWK
jgi:hypothetical protein